MQVLERWVQTVCWARGLIWAMWMIWDFGTTVPSGEEAPLIKTLTEIPWVKSAKQGTLQSAFSAQPLGFLFLPESLA